MLRATLYIMGCSSKNRIRRRLQRLREPRYLLGALAGSAYLYLSFFGGLRSRRAALEGGRRVGRLAFMPAFGSVGPAVAGLSLLLAAGASLVVPFRSSLFDFSKAEREFLFPAPVSRRQLMGYRLVRVQWAPFFSALIVSLTFPLALPSARLRGFIGMWLALMTCRVVFAGITLTRAGSTPPAARARWVAWVPRLAIVGALAVLAAETGQAIARHRVSTADDVLSLLATVSAQGVTGGVLRPFAAVVRPLFADSWASFVMALLGAVAVYGVAVAWLLASDEAFDAVSTGAPDDAAVGATTGAAAHRARSTAWELPLHGLPELALVWKAANQTVRSVGRRFFVTAALVVAWLTAAVLVTSQTRGLAQAVGLLSAAGAVFSVFMGPQMLRLDLRQDLRHLELLKTWPIRGAALVRGEMFWPVALITAVAWVLGAAALTLSAIAFEQTGVAWRLATGVGAMVLAPALVLAQYTIHMAVALIFPAWVVTGRPRGVDSMGQRMIVLGATLLALVLAVAPALAIGGVLWTAFSGVAGPWILVPAAAIGAVIVASEAWLASEMLGRVYDGLDLTSVERAE